MKRLFLLYWNNSWNITLWAILIFLLCGLLLGWQWREGRERCHRSSQWSSYPACLLSLYFTVSVCVCETFWSYQFENTRNTVFVLLLIFLHICAKIWKLFEIFGELKIHKCINSYMDSWIFLFYLSLKTAWFSCYAANLLPVISLKIKVRHIALDRTILCYILSYHNVYLFTSFVLKMWAHEIFCIWDTKTETQDKRFPSETYLSLLSALYVNYYWRNRNQKTEVMTQDLYCTGTVGA